ncbi:MAG: SDR family oxidoreductase [Candidatus Accumulibacter sp.]|nr:SDR family oxidoreductase [Accumulibacter sp.]
MRDFFRRVGSFDHLAMIIKAALPHDTFLSSDLNAVRAAFETKFWGQYRLARHAAEWLRPDGSMVFTSGVASRRATPGMSVVSAMNAATEALARVLAVELAPIRVNTVSPGLVDARPLDPAQPERLQKLVQYVPLARLGGTAEIAEAYLYLFGNAYTTGSVMVVDGGVAC